MAEGKPGQYLVSFESGHYKKFEGEWKGDSVWAHFQTNHSVIHVNKDKVEYIEQFTGNPVLGKTLKEMADELKGRTKMENDKMQAEIDQIRAHIDLLKAEAEKLRRKR